MGECQREYPEIGRKRRLSLCGALKAFIVIVSSLNACRREAMSNK
jgi:hypothetical protein